MESSSVPTSLAHTDPCIIRGSYSIVTTCPATPPDGAVHQVYAL